MLVVVRPGPNAWRRHASLLIVGAFVAFLAAQAPHLVHHFFESEHVQDECPFAANGERTSGLETPPVALVAITDVSTPWRTATLVAAPTVAPAASRGRAPPARIS